VSEYKVHISGPAEQDIKKVIQYIDSSLRNPLAADDLLEAIEKAFSSVTFFPEKYPLVKDPVLAAQGIRLLMIKNYLALYTVDEGTGIIYIVRFLYGKRNWQSILKNEK